MISYKRNIECACQRCRLHRSTGGVILITLGILFLLGEFTAYSFHRTSPVFLIVLGLMLFARSRASLEGHRPGSYAGCGFAPNPGPNLGTNPGAGPGSPAAPSAPGSSFTSGYSGGAANSPASGPAPQDSSSISSSSSEVRHG